MEIGEEVSQQLTVLKLLLIVGVLFLHAPSKGDAFAEGVVTVAPGAAFNLLAGTFLQSSEAAVPLLFLMAGFVLFSKPLCNGARCLT